MLPAAWPRGCRMRRTVTIAAVLLAVGLGAFSLDLTRPTSLIAKSAMPDPALTGAPSQGTCFTCHNGALNDPTALSRYTTCRRIRTRPDLRHRHRHRPSHQRQPLGLRGHGLDERKPDGGDVGRQQYGRGQANSGRDHVHLPNDAEGFDGTYADSAGQSGPSTDGSSHRNGAGDVLRRGGRLRQGQRRERGGFTYTSSVSCTEEPRRPSRPPPGARSSRSIGERSRPGATRAPRI